MLSRALQPRALVDAVVIACAQLNGLDRRLQALLVLNALRLVQRQSETLVEADQAPAHIASALAHIRRHASHRLPTDRQLEGMLEAIAQSLLHTTYIDPVAPKPQSPGIWRRLRGVIGGGRRPFWTLPRVWMGTLLFLGAPALGLFTPTGQAFLAGIDGVKLAVVVAGWLVLSGVLLRPRWNFGAAASSVGRRVKALFGQQPTGPAFLAAPKLARIDIKKLVRFVSEMDRQVLGLQDNTQALDAWLKQAGAEQRAHAGVDTGSVLSGLNAIHPNVDPAREPAHLTSVEAAPARLIRQSSMRVVPMPERLHVDQRLTPIQGKPLQKITQEIPRGEIARALTAWANEPLDDRLSTLFREAECARVDFETLQFADGLSRLEACQTAIRAWTAYALALSAQYGSTACSEQSFRAALALHGVRTETDIMAKGREYGNLAGAFLNSDALCQAHAARGGVVRAHASAMQQLSALYALEDELTEPTRAPSIF